MAVLRELLEAGKITPIIDSTYPFSEVREALRHVMEDEIRGKVILTPAEVVRHALAPDRVRVVFRIATPAVPVPGELQASNAGAFA